MNIDLSFRNIEQEQFFWHRERNGLFDGGFNNGKSYVGCERAFVHLMTFPNYGMVIARQQYKVLKATTMKTFFKVCPKELVHTHDKQDGYTILTNGSFIYWMHLDDVDEQDIRGLEINSVLLDQAEEIKENIYLVMDFRVGRWDKAKVPLWLLRNALSDINKEVALKIERDKPKELENFINLFTTWPKHPKWGQFLVPNYMDALCNPSDEDEFHWTYRYFNPNSTERRPDHFYIHRESDESLTDSKSYQQALLRDPEWVDKYIRGKTGSPKAQIHKLDKLSIINPDEYPPEDFEKLLNLIKTRGTLSRILDHGDTGVTACGWLCLLNNLFIFFKEYYITGGLISENRQNIADISEDDEYSINIADPQIFRTTNQQISKLKSGFRTVAEQYHDTEITDAPPIHWAPADNSELATRIRINEFLAPNPKYFHPITKVSPAPRIYLINKGKNYPFGCANAITQIQQQRKLLLGSDNGRNIYSDERDDTIADHAYDYVRYGIAAYGVGRIEVKRKAPRNSFAYFNGILKKRHRVFHRDYEEI